MSTTPSSTRTAALIATTLALLATMLAPGWAADRYDPTVLNGDLASIADLPAAVYLDPVGCTGTIIAAEWVLTAAHCFAEGEAASAFDIIVGRDDISDAVDLLLEDFVGGQQIVYHPDWDPGTETGVDAALLKLAEPVTVAAMPLAEEDAADPAGETGVIAGWGATTIDEDGADSGGGDFLRRADVPILDDAECIAAWGEEWDQEDWYVCAGGEESDACQGDSGGPLMIEEDGGFLQVGIVAWGESCTVETGTHGAYISVGFVRSWIDETIGASAEPEPDPAEGDGGTGFDDVPTDHPHATGITYVSDEGITGGCGGGNYCPTTKVSRAQMATFLTNALRLTASGDPDFDDVPADHVHATGITAVAEEGITTGCGGGNFCPAAKVSRAQMATFLANALGLTASGDPEFDDVPADHLHAAGIAAVAEAGITTGCGGGNFCPTTQVSRAQMATFLMNALEG